MFNLFSKSAQKCGFLRVNVTFSPSCAKKREYLREYGLVIARSIVVTNCWNARLFVGVIVGADEVMLWNQKEPKLILIQ